MMKAMLVTAAVAAAAGTASAQLTIDVVGVPGAGTTTWNFGGGTGTVAIDGAIRTNADGASFNAGDTGQFPFGLDTILNTGYQDVVFDLTGNAMITVGGTTEMISGIFLDDDGGSADDLGVRAANTLNYLAGDSSSWTGSGTANVDINDFAGGVWSINGTDGQAMFIADEVVVTFRAVPAPASLALLGLGGLVARRRR